MIYNILNKLKIVKKGIWVTEIHPKKFFIRRNRIRYSQKKNRWTLIIKRKGCSVINLIVEIVIWFLGLNKNFIEKSWRDVGK